MTDTAAPTGAPAAPAPAPSPAAPPAAPSEPIETASLIEPGKAPPVGSDAYLRASKAASLVRFGHWSIEQAKAALAEPAGVGAPTSGAPNENGEATPPGSSDASMPTRFSEAEALIAGQNVATALHDPVVGLHDGEARLYGAALARSLASPPSADQINATQAATLHALNQLHPGKAQKVVEDANAELRHIAATVPGLANLPQMIRAAGAGNDLHTILRLAERAAQRAKASVLKAAGK